MGQFKTRYRAGTWTIETWEGHRLHFGYNAYLSFLEIYGYLNAMTWPLAEGDAVLDAGACFGEFALYASRVVGRSGKVVMLEPDPANLAVFEENCRRNGGKPDNLIVLQLALWNRTEVLKFSAGLGGASGLVDAAASASSSPAAAAASVMNVEATDLENILERAGLNSFRFIKMDIEGAEIEVVDHEAERFARDGTRLAIASYHLRDGKPTSIAIGERLKRAGMNVTQYLLSHPTTHAEVRP